MKRLSQQSKQSKCEAQPTGAQKVTLPADSNLRPCLSGLVTYKMNVELSASRTGQFPLLVHPEQAPYMTEAGHSPVP